MNTTKRLLTMILVCFMLLSLGTFAASYSDVPASHERFEAIDSLSSSDIITGFPDGSFKPDESVTRAQMAALITRMFKLSSGTVDAMPFSDVAKDHWASSNILAAKKMGVINGFPDGTFKPDDKVTYEQAVKMIVSSLNYGSAAEAKGGWPNGYIQQAASLGITKKAIMAQSEPSPRGMIAQLLFNSTTVDMLVPVIKPDGSVEYQKPTTPNTVKDQFLGTKTIKNALVVAIPNVTLGAPELFCQPDEIWVRSGSTDIKLKVGTKTNAKDFIGQAVDIDYTENSQTKDLVLARITSPTSNKTYTIDITNIEKIADDNSYIEYYENKGDENTKKLSFSSTVNSIYNERYDANGMNLLKNDIASAEALNVSGTLTIVVGSTFTVVKIKSYKTYFMTKAADTANYKITVDIPTNANGLEITIPMNDTYTNQIVLKKKNGDTYSDLTSLASISRNSLVSIAQSNNIGNKYHEVLVAPNAVTGTIIEEFTENGEKNVKIGAKTYAVAKGFETLYPDLFNKVKYDTNATYYVDCFGYIAWATNISFGNIKNGLLVDVNDSGSGLDKVIIAKFFDLKSKSEFTVSLDGGTSDLSKLVGKNNNLFSMKVSSKKSEAAFVNTVGNIKNGDIKEVGGSDTIEWSDVKSISHSSATTVKYSNSKYKFDTESTAATLTDVTLIFKPLSSTDSDRKFVTGTFVSEIEYGNPKHYTVTENGRTYNYILVDTLQKILDSSPVYIVKEKGSSKSVNNGEDQVVEYKLYNFKDGTEKTINILESVSNVLGLLKGDVFTYYKTSTKENVEIDRSENVTVTLKIDKAIATNKSIGYDGVETTTKDGNSTSLLAGKTDGYSILTIYKDKYFDANYDYSVTYSLQLPILYANENSLNELYLSMNRSSAQTVPTEVYLPNNINTTDIDFTNDGNIISKIENIMVKPTTSNKVFVYNASETDETKKLVTVTTQDEINSLLDNLKTVKDVKLEVQNADLIYSSIQNNYNNAVALKTIYIIKR